MTKNARGRWLVCAAAIAAAAAAAPAQAAPPPEPAVQRTVIEDDGVRIEELRVRGRVQRIVVQPKAQGARAYEIDAGQNGRDLSQDRRGAGKSVWNVFSF